MSKITVALPVWQANRSIWLVLESLCRQVKPINKWELICFEENNVRFIGEDYIRSYESRLKEVGCESIRYMTSETKYPLSQKWVMIAQESSSSSEAFILCAADNYYSPYMLRDCEDVIIYQGRDWALFTRGFFYDFFFEKIIHYNIANLVGLQMAARASVVRQFPMEEYNSGVDTWFSENMWKIKGRGNLKIWIDGSDHWKQILCTNGLNNISTERYRFFENIREPFYKTDVKLEEIVPEDICNRIKELSRCLKSL